MTNGLSLQRSIFFMKTQPPSALPAVLKKFNERDTLQEAMLPDGEFARVTLDSIGDAVISTDLDGFITYLNAVAETMTGWPMAEAKGRYSAEVLRLMNGVTREMVPRNPMSLAIKEDNAVDLAANTILIRRDGSECFIEDSIAPIHNRDGTVIGAVMVFRDVSQTREAVSRMSHLAQHDPLTDLPNTTLLSDRISQAIALARRNEKQLAVLYLDIDHFKRINDTLGHAVGDQLLQSVAGRLIDCVRDSDTVCRKGGDEFVVLISEINHREHASRIAKKIIQSIAEGHLLAEHKRQVSVSIGISIYPQDGDDDQSLIKSADAAMYQAKRNGRNQYCFYNEAMNDAMVELLTMARSRPS